MTTFSVTKNGKVLNPSLYTWDEKTKTFSTKENGLVLDFTDVNRVTFNTGPSCTFNTGYFCTFNTGYFCTFKASSHCTFKTGNSCTFITGSSCTFNTGSYCTFKTDFDCTFKTGYSCAFNTGSDCRFEVRKNCSLIRYDVQGVTEIPANKKIKLNGYENVGYTFIEEKKETSSCNGKKYKLVKQQRSKGKKVLSGSKVMGTKQK